jgi:carbonic anhydrase
MKDWQFYFAILFLLFLLLPIYEGNTDKGYSANDIIQIKNQTENNKLQTDNVETKIKYIMSHPGSTTELASGKYTIKNGSTYCADEGDRFLCNRPAVWGAWEVQDIINLGGGYYNIKGGKNNKFCADDNDRFVCNRDAAAAWENTQIINLGGGNYNIKGGRLRKFCHYDGNKIICDRDMPTASGIFQILPT